MMTGASTPRPWRLAQTKTWVLDGAGKQTQNKTLSLNGRHASRCLPAFLAAAHLFFIASASLFRPSSLSLPRRERGGAAALFGAVPVPPVFLAAQRLFVASMILLRPSGLRCLFRDLL